MAYADESVRRLLQREGFRFVSGRPEHLRGDAGARSAFGACGALRPVEARFQDEARVDRKGMMSRLWARRGARPARRPRPSLWLSLPVRGCVRGARQGGGPGVGAGGHGGDERAFGGYRRGCRAGKHRRRCAGPGGGRGSRCLAHPSCCWNCRPIAPNPTRWRRCSSIRGATASPTGCSPTPPQRSKPVARLGTGSPPRLTGLPPSCAANGVPSSRRLRTVITDD